MMTVRAAVAEDRDSVVGVWEASGISQPWNDPPHDFDRAVAAENSDVLVVEDSAVSRIAAACIVGDDGHRGWVHMAGVAPDVQRQGVGNLLAHGALDWFRSCGLASAHLLIAQGNTAGEQFWRQVGFFPLEASSWGIRLEP